VNFATGVTHTSAILLNPDVVDGFSRIAPSIGIFALAKTETEVSEVKSLDINVTITLCPYHKEITNNSVVYPIWWDPDTNTTSQTGCFKADTQPATACLTFMCDHLALFSLETNQTLSTTAVNNTGNGTDTTSGYLLALVTGALLLWI
jgi:hypothetical protein